MGLRGRGEAMWSGVIVINPFQYEFKGSVISCACISLSWSVNNKAGVKFVSLFHRTDIHKSKTKEYGSNRGLLKFMRSMLNIMHNVEQFVCLHLKQLMFILLQVPFQHMASLMACFVHSWNLISHIFMLH